MLLQKIDGGTIGSRRGEQFTSGSVKICGKSVKTLRLVILSKNELIGLEEIIEDRTVRTKTVKCVSQAGMCYFITKEDFIHCVNLFRFSQAVIEEQILKHQLISNRIFET